MHQTPAESGPHNAYQCPQGYEPAPASYRDAHSGEHLPKCEKRPEYDPIATATWVLAVIGAAQAGLFLWQLTLIRKGADDATIAANAAKDAANAALDANQLATKQFEAAQRPWVGVKSLVLEQPLTWDVNGWRFTVLFELHNSGNMPAQNVNISVEVSGAPINVAQDRQEANRVGARRADRFFNNVIFPGEPYIQSFVVYITKNEAEAIMEHEGTHFALPFIFGFVSYSSPTDVLVHQTGFMVNVSVNNGALMYRMDDPEGREIPLNQLIVKRWVKGWYAD